MEQSVLQHFPFLPLPNVPRVTVIVENAKIQFVMHLQNHFRFDFFILKRLAMFTIATLMMSAALPEWAH